MGNKTKDGRYVVAWSGGVDSTALLDWYATISSEATKIVAVSVAGHQSMNQHQLKAQNEAQKNYLKHARSKGYHIEHRKIRMSGNKMWDGPTSGTAQPILWAFAVAGSLQDNDTVLMGYICKDDFWHYKHQFVEMFSAICKFKGVKADIEFPFEWKNKEEVLEQAAKIPKNCWFSCDYTEDGKPCKRCDKCLVIDQAYKAIKKRRKALKKQVIEMPMPKKKRRSKNARQKA